MDVEDYEENLRALDRTLTELRAELKSTKDDDAKASRLEQEIAAVDRRKRELLAAKTEACGGSRDSDLAPTFEHGFGSVLQEYTLLGELKLAGRQNVPGVYVRGHPATSFAWDGVIFLHDGLYEGACFKFRVIIPPKYPDHNVPRVFFQSQITHPMINEMTGELDMKRHFPAWDPKRNRLWHVLRCIRHIFFTIDTDHPANAGAAALYKMGSAAFRTVAQKSVKASVHAATSRVGNTIDMHAWDDSYESVLRVLKQFDKHSTKRWREMQAQLERQGRARAGMQQTSDTKTAQVLSTITHRLAREADTRKFTMEPRLKPYIHAVLGKHGETTDVRLADWGCSGHVTLWREDTETLERRWLLLDEHRGTLTVFATEREEKEVSSLPIDAICSCHQDDDTAASASNMFVVVTPTTTLRCGALSSDGLHVWLSAIVHAMTLKPGEAAPRDDLEHTTTALY
ncbi:hypothetical protein PTSG_06668 [Salpingoeca rosetta]|uniref:UBC core domain-containing protein n=1 Tax=Salpingoeca rosetta (strain ATCC 50818 / BSB-021) TaxID=946362 RepID=F2UFN3_SALR5|nr:uncharacterized protein PTSG_06668 [Salpingoeca rosetta]EGD75601.1 hypothetical protein PTSG_06668 [Salpingoeca rosetta]|eukprot:XP_004992058.1 hypothetical protein PTSG_06668 [Salpingoeca rosetta]